jgi:hypothetical protein
VYRSKWQIKLADQTGTPVYTRYKHALCCTISSEIDVLEHNKKMNHSFSFGHAFTQPFRLIVTLLACTTLGIGSGLAQQKPDPKYVVALATIYAGGATASLIKDWCDERAPNLKDQNAAALESWRKKMDLPNIDARLTALIGDGKGKIDAGIEEKREAFYTQLDGSSTNPETDCKDLEKSLNDDFNLKILYPKEYALIATQPANPNGATAGGGSGSSTGSGKGSSGSGSTVGTTPSTDPTPVASKLPVMPPFDYTQFAKLKLNPEKEPIPDEYHCYPEIRGEKYATHLLTLQILPGRKYRAGIGSAVSEGNFKIDGYDLFITSGAFASKRKHFYTFNRKGGAEIWLYDLGSEENEIDFRCYQRGGSEQIQQLNFKRKDPQPGSYPCVKTDGSNQSAGTLEILPNRRYKHQGSEGTYKVNITGKLSDDNSGMDFNGGGLDGNSSFYEESEAGRQQYRFYRPDFECTRQVAPRPNPKFGPAKAPPVPGAGGLEGRYFYGRTQVIDFNNNLPCQGICYDYLIFQKNGYVYSDDLEDTEGLEDANCAKTYPSGFPVCETYTVKGNMLQVGLEKPEVFKRTKDGLEIDGDEWDVLEPLDGLKFNLAYYTQRIYGAIIGTGGGSSSTDLSLRKDGRFTRESSNSFFFGATDTGTSTGNITAGVGGSSSRSNNGSYKVYGNTIEFKYDDGRTIKLFMFLPSGRKDLTFLHIGGSIYWEQKKK